MRTSGRFLLMDEISQRIEFCFICGLISRITSTVCSMGTATTTTSESATAVVLLLSGIIPRVSAVFLNSSLRGSDAPKRNELRSLGFPPFYSSCVKRNFIDFVAFNDVF